MGRPRIQGRVVQPGEGLHLLAAEIRKGVLSPARPLGALTTAHEVTVAEVTMAPLDHRPTETVMDLPIQVQGLEG